MGSIHEDGDEITPYEPTESERLLAAQIMGDADPEEFLALHPVQSADEVEEFVRWVESRRVQAEIDAYIESQAEELAAELAAERLDDEGGDE